MNSRTRTELGHTAVEIMSLISQLDRIIEQVNMSRKRLIDLWGSIDSKLDLPEKIKCP